MQKLFLSPKIYWSISVISDNGVVIAIIIFLFPEKKRRFSFFGEFLEIEGFSFFHFFLFFVFDLLDKRRRKKKRSSEGKRKIVGLKIWYWYQCDCISFHFFFPCYYYRFFSKEE